MMNVFKMVIDLNLARNIHSQINSVMSQKYLGDGRANEDDAIATLENELKSIEGDLSKKKSNNTA